jgi:hypothetical protein
MEARLGADFSSVRVHTDATASASAEAVNARAYTVGSDIVFGSGRFDPGSDSGLRLVTHELVHVAQQRGVVSSGPLELGAHDSEPEREADKLSAGAAAGSARSKVRATATLPAVTTLRRQPASSTMTRPPNTCDPEQTRVMQPAVSKAQSWLHTADQGLTQFLANPAAPPAARAAAALKRYFPPGDAATARYVQDKIRQIAQRLRTDEGAPNVLTVQCHTLAQDPSCPSAAAYVLGPLLVFCPSFFIADQTFQIVTMVHEIAHSLVPATQPLHITDRAYQSDRKFQDLSPGEALSNAESYAILVQQLGLGTAVASTAPKDTPHDCPPDWTPLLTGAAEDAERWNRDALVTVSDRRPGWLAGYAGLCDTYLGGHTPALLDAAVADYTKMESAFHDGIDFECEPSGGGRCDTSETYWYAIFSHLHVCPIWRKLAAADDRAEGILTGMYGYQGNVDGQTRRRNLARLARALHYKSWAPPSAAAVTSALAAPGAGTPPAPSPH